MGLRTTTPIGAAPRAGRGATPCRSRSGRRSTDRGQGADPLQGGGGIQGLPRRASGRGNPMRQLHRGTRPAHSQGPRCEPGSAARHADLLVILVMGSLYRAHPGVESGDRPDQARRPRSGGAPAARDALVARAAPTPTGRKPAPARTATTTGVAELLAGNACPSYIGSAAVADAAAAGPARQVPVRRLWYVLSQPFTDSSASVINSDTQGSPRS